jgi:hypothetical protein
MSLAVAAIGYKIFRHKENEVPIIETESIKE